MRLSTILVSVCLGAAISIVAACSDDSGGGNEAEVITTVTLAFTPAAGGAAMSFEVDDPDGDGGDPPTADPLDLTAGMFTVAVGFENRLEDPPEIITVEVMDESDQHQVFFTGSAVNGPASDQPGAPLTHGYADTDVNGFPTGLANTIIAAAGTGTLTITLRHLPPVNDVPVKTADLASQVRSGGIGSIGGSTDATVNFTVTVL